MSGYLHIIWKNKYENKIRIYETCIRLVMIYAIDIRAETVMIKREQQK